MDMRSAHSADIGAKGVTGSTKRHIISRLQKASVCASRLVDLLEDTEASKANSEAILEARAYYVSLNGAMAFEKKHWRDCIQNYSEARCIYTTIVTAQSEGGEDLVRDLLSSTVDSSIRYAAYQLKVPRTTSIDNVVAQYVSRSNNKYVEEVLRRNPGALDGRSSNDKRFLNNDSVDIPKTIQWRSRTVKIEDAATAQALAAVSSAEKKLSSFLSSSRDASPRAKAAAYDEILILSQDAVDATRTAIDEFTADDVPQSDPRMQALQITRTALNYALIGWRIGRNRVLCGERDGAILEPLKPKRSRKVKRTSEVSKPQAAPEERDSHRLKRLKERVVLYDATLQSLDSIHLLPGVAADQTFLQEVEAKNSYFAALRCLAISRSYYLLGNTKNSLALLARASEHCSKTIHSAALSEDDSSDKPPDLTVTSCRVEKLQTLLQCMLSQHRALVELRSLSGSVPQINPNNTVPLIRKLHRYPREPVELTALVTYPPKVEPIPVKPIFLDVAYNYIEYPGRTKMLTEQPAVVNGISNSGGKNEVRKGWFGFGR